MGPAAPSETLCVFCEIVSGRSPAYKVYEDEKNVAFLDLFPFTKGHLLVVPKVHVPRLTDLPESEYQNFLRAVSTVCRRVERISQDYNIALNQGARAGQIVFHLHFHVIPRYDNENPFGTDRPRLEAGEAADLVAALSAP